MAVLLHLAWTFLWLSFIAVGGGLGVLPEMQRQVVERYGWVTAREFVDGYTLSQLTPGPNMLVAIFVGYRAHGLVGALVAGVAVFLPTSLLTAIVARRWARLRDRPWALAAERALAPVGIGLMGAGVYTLARSAVHDWSTAALAAAATVVLAARWLPPVVVVLVGGLVGWLAGV
jgi:chromate transporter